MIKKGIGAELRRLRNEHKLTQEALAHNADVAIAFVKEIEVGKKQPTATTLFKLAYALGVTPNDLISSTYEEWRSQQE